MNGGHVEPSLRRGCLKLLAILAICVLPVVASYAAYYFRLRPVARTNYGTLIDPRAHPLPVLGEVLFSEGARPVSALRGKWVLLTVDDAACRAQCRKRLIDMRQLRLMQEREMDRIERVWLVTDGARPPPDWLRAIAGTHVLGVANEKLANWLPGENRDGENAYALYLIDPLGNLIMRYPPDADPMKIDRDLAKLLRASRIG